MDWFYGLDLVASLMFSMMIGCAIYLMLLLRPTSKGIDESRELEALKLEHQACLTLFQTMLTGMVVLFLGTLLLQ